MISISSPNIGSEEIKEASEVLLSGNLIQGGKVKEFENIFSKFIGVKYGIATSSGTTALQVALEAIGIKAGDEVITTPFSFIATSNAVLYQKAKPIFADIDPKTFNIKPENIRKGIKKETKAVLVVHLYGHPCEMGEIKDICERHNIILIEDCAQAIGAEYKKKKVGSFGDVSCFSFYPTKNITTGEGGMILTNNKDVEYKSRAIRDHGKRNESHETLGYNFRLTEFQAAIGLVQMKKIDQFNRKRDENSRILSENIKNNRITKPYVDPNVKHAWNQYTIRVSSRDDLSEFLNKSGIGTRIYYKKPIYAEPVYKRFGYKEVICPEAEKASNQVLSLPIHPKLTQNEVLKVAEVVNKFV